MMQQRHQRFFLFQTAFANARPQKTFPQGYSGIQPFIDGFIDRAHAALAQLAHNTVSAL